MAPADRRAALIAATVPLLHEHGMDVSTKAIAQAAGVAEGTIFGVFPDKGSLLRAALLQALDPQSMLDALAAIDPGADLRTRLTAAADALILRFTEQSHLMTAARGLVMSADAGPEWYERMMASRERTLAAVTAVIEPDRDRLRRSPATVARLLVLIVGGSSHGMFGATERLTGAEMVEVLLDGLAVRPSDTGPPHPGPRHTGPRHTDPPDDEAPDDDRGGPVPC